MRRSRLLAVALLSLPCAARGQEPILYEISFENRAHHEAEITVDFPDVGPGPLQIRMSRTSPGRYALHEFAKNVYDFRATGLGGREVDVDRPDPHQWTVRGHGGHVRVTYTLYGDRADGTYAGVDRTHAHLNMPATFIWARGLEARPLRLTIRPPEGSGWRVATQLQATDDPFVYTASDLQYFMDSPTEVSAFWERRWSVEGPSGEQSVRVALHHAGSDEDAARYADAVEAIVAGAAGIFGELPSFDLGEYTFLACYLPWAAGDGMEHRNSTVLTSTGSLARNMTGLLGTVAHEFFHAWNVERIRPASLEPFDFEAANMSQELWFAEGFTNYFDDVILWRAGLIDDGTFAARMGGIANAVEGARGRLFFSPVEMSMQAPFVDAAVSIEPTNRANTFLSYYTWGSGIALGLDLTLRARFEEVTLDHLMREMWRSHGTPAIPYTVHDIEAALARIAGDEEFAREFFERYVWGREAPDFAALLSGAGIELGRALPGRATLGRTSLRHEESGVVLLETPLIGTPLYEAGLDRGDRIVAVNGELPETAEVFERIVGGLRPGDSVSLSVRSRGSELTVQARVTEEQALTGRLMDASSLDAGRRETFSRWKAGLAP